MNKNNENTIFKRTKVFAFKKQVENSNAKSTLHPTATTGTNTSYVFVCHK